MITLRRATPADAVEVSHLIDISSGGGRIPLMGLIFPGPKEKRLGRIQRLFIDGEMIYMHHGRYIIAEINGKIAGTLCTFDSSHDTVSSWWSAFRKIGLPFFEPLCIAFRLIPYFLSIPRADPEALLVETVATFDEFRGAGVAHLLLEYVMHEGRMKGYRSIQVACLIGNDAALSLYKKAGFLEKERKTSILFKKIVGVPGIIRLEINLEQEEAMANKTSNQHLDL